MCNVNDDKSHWSITLYTNRLSYLARCSSPIHYPHSFIEHRAKDIYKKNLCILLESKEEARKMLQLHLTSHLDEIFVRILQESKLKKWAK